jgi:hypothetical protein
MVFYSSRVMGQGLPSHEEPSRWKRFLVQSLMHFISSPVFRISSFRSCDQISRVCLGFELMSPSFLPEGNTDIVEQCLFTSPECPLCSNVWDIGREGQALT